eukprot:SM000004S14976  [mRNA]  locus=s4:555168:560744:- [translate_table: standard]
MTIESSARDESGYNEVVLAQLNLIDLAGSESSKTGTTGLRRKEGSYINKSLLTLGTVISKLSEGRAAHVPYRDSKLTRLLQSSLCGQGRISLICTITPASSAFEETHNTLKFAGRAKYVEVNAEKNKVRHTCIRMYCDTPPAMAVITRAPFLGRHQRCQARQTLPGALPRLNVTVDFPLQIIDEKSLIKKYQREISELRLELEQLKLERPAPGSMQDDFAILRTKFEADQQLMVVRLEEEEQAKAALLGRIQRLTKLILVSTNTTLDAPSLAHQGPNNRRRLSFGEEDLAYLANRHSWNEAVDSAEAADDLLADDKKGRKRSMLGWFKLKKDAASLASPERPTPEKPTAEAAVSPLPSMSFRATWAKGELAKSEVPASAARLAARDSPPPVLSTQAGELFRGEDRRGETKKVSTVADQLELLREQSRILSAEVALLTSTLKRINEQSPGQQEEHKRVKELIREKRRQLKQVEARVANVTQLLPSADNAVQDEMGKTIAKLKAALSEKTFDLESKQNTKLLEEINLLRVELTKASSHSTLTMAPLTTTSSNMETMLSKPTFRRSSSVSGHPAANEGSPGSRGQEKGRPSLSQTAELEDLKMQVKVLLDEKVTLVRQQRQLASELAESRAAAIAKPGARLDGAYVNEKAANRLKALQYREAEQAARGDEEGEAGTAPGGQDEVLQQLQKELGEAKERESGLENDLATMWILVAELRRHSSTSQELREHLPEQNGSVGHGDELLSPAGPAANQATGSLEALRRGSSLGASGNEEQAQQNIRKHLQQFRSPRSSGPRS